MPRNEMGPPVLFHHVLAALLSNFLSPLFSHPMYQGCPGLVVAMLPSNHPPMTWPFLYFNMAKLLDLLDVISYSSLDSLGLIFIHLFRCGLTYCQKITPRWSELPPICSKAFVPWWEAN